MSLVHAFMMHDMHKHTHFLQHTMYMYSTAHMKGKCYVFPTGGTWGTCRSFPERKYCEIRRLHMTRNTCVEKRHPCKLVD